MKGRWKKERLDGQGVRGLDILTVVTEWSPWPGIIKSALILAAITR